MLVDVNYVGRLGNNIFQYCFGRILSSELGCEIKVDDLKDFPNARAIFPSGKSSYLIEEILEGHQVDLNSILSNKEDRKITLNGYFQRYEYYKRYKDLLKKDWLYLEPLPSFGESEISINIRAAGDIWKINNPGPIHPNYMALPFSYYESILTSGNWSKV